MVVISDLVEAYPSPHFSPGSFVPSAANPDVARSVPVVGGYLERLPLAAVRTGLVETAEIWHHHRGDLVVSQTADPLLVRRAFPTAGDAPFHSEAMVEFVRQHGAPRILVVLGLGVSEALLEACRNSFIIYNSIDAPALRVRPEVSRHFDLVVTGAEWQSDEVAARHPGMPTLVLPIGPEFASPDTFFPIPETEKRYDVVYVAAAQPYKRHDVLFDALARSSRPLSALCVMGYGENGEQLRQDAAARGLQVDFIGPPGVSHAEVNRLMNQARVGVVCGVDDGAPAILTEYMLAGLPVVANAALRCGLQFIKPDTGIAVTADRFEHGIIAALERGDFRPREHVLAHWAWPHSISRLAEVVVAQEAHRSMTEPKRA